MVKQLKNCLFKWSVRKSFVVISHTEHGEVLERWQFAIEYDKAHKDDSTLREKYQEARQDEVRWVIRQNTVTVTFLSQLELSCSCDLLI